jgi:hypothetical protein
VVAGYAPCVLLVQVVSLWLLRPTLDLLGPPSSPVSAKADKFGNSTDLTSDSVRCESERRREPLSQKALQHDVQVSRARTKSLQFTAYGRCRSGQPCRNCRRRQLPRRGQQPHQIPAIVIEPYQAAKEASQAESQATACMMSTVTLLCKVKSQGFVPMARTVGSPGPLAEPRECGFRLVVPFWMGASISKSALVGWRWSSIERG